MSIFIFPKYYPREAFCESWVLSLQSLLFILFLTACFCEAFVNYRFHLKLLSVYKRRLLPTNSPVNAKRNRFWTDFKARSIRSLEGTTPNKEGSPLCSLTQLENEGYRPSSLCVISSSSLWGILPSFQMFIEQKRWPAVQSQQFLWDSIESHSPIHNLALIKWKSKVFRLTFYLWDFNSTSQVCTASVYTAAKVVPCAF